jgi:hypothetical protein
MAGIVAPKGKSDLYANVAFGVVTESAINTLTFAQIQMAVGLFQGIAMVIHRILWHLDSATARELVAATDQVDMALVSSNRLASISDVNDPAIIGKYRITGVGAAIAVMHFPLISDYTMLPGGGKICAANPLWLGLKMAGAAAVGTCRAQLEFTFIELTDRDYLELIQAQFPANVV